MDVPCGPVAKIQAPDAGSLSSISGQETRSHMPQIRACKLQLKIPHVVTKDLTCHNKDRKSQVESVLLLLETVLALTYYQHSIKNTKKNPILSVKRTSDS